MSGPRSIPISNAPLLPNAGFARLASGLLATAVLGLGGCGGTAPPSLKPPPHRETAPRAARPAFGREAIASWTAYLDGVERTLRGRRLDADRLVALSDLLRSNRDAALSLYGSMPGPLLRRSANLIARLEQTRVDRSRPVPLGWAAVIEDDPPSEEPLIFLRGGRRTQPPPPRFERLPQGTFVFRWPLDAIRLTSPFGLRRDPFQSSKWAFHNGLDLGGAKGTDVLATGPGRVVFAGSRRDGCGRTVVIRHTDGFASEYCHLDAVDVVAGDAVEGGARIGRIGSTGRSTGAHLHWIIRRHGVALDPADVVGRRSDAVR